MNVVYTENDGVDYSRDNSYEFLTQNLTQETTTTTNIDLSNIFRTLLDNGLDLLADAYDPTTEITDITSSSESFTCPEGYKLVNGMCEKIKEDNIKKYLIYGIAGIVIISVIYVLHKKYGK